MFNSPILDVTIGLVFLLYSLLATSIKEAIATALGLRGKMLRKGIVESMLSDTPSYGRWTSIAVGIWNTIRETFFVIIGKRLTGKEKIGDRFYNHPLIKNYGASRLFPLPSYIPAANFSTVLIDLLQKDFSEKITEIAEWKRQASGSAPDSNQVIEELMHSSELIKIRTLLSYYSWLYQSGRPLQGVIIDKDTCDILLMHLQKSAYDMQLFTSKLETWFNESMDRVSGWYKRQVQVILFIIGIVIAVLFNVDTIEIAGKLSTDKDARDKIVELAEKAADRYKDDPRLKTPGTSDATKDTIMKNYQFYMTQARNTIDSGIQNSNEILAVGWGNYGRNDSAFLKTLYDKIWIGFFYTADSGKIMDSVRRLAVKLYKQRLADIAEQDSVKTIASKRELAKQKSVTKKENNLLGVQKQDVIKPDSEKLLNEAFYNYQFTNYPVHVKTAYVWYSIKTQKKKWLGFLITAFAICLGAPFWFDLLNKLIRLRSAGKQESNAAGAEKNSDQAAQPVTVNVNTQNPGEEAVG
jgi:hypothetical protein